MKLIGGSARRIFAVGALAMGMLVAGAGVAAADTTDAARFRVTAGPLILSHDGTHYTGTMRVTVRNVGGAPATDASLSLGMPPGLQFLGVDNGGGCIGANPIGCVLFDPPAPPGGAKAGSGAPVDEGGSCAKDGGCSTTGTAGIGSMVLVGLALAFQRRRRRIPAT